MTEDTITAPPRHPLYLDVPMMTSFLAYLEGGVAESLERVSTAKSDASKQREGGAGLKFPSVFSLLGFDASCRIASTSATGVTDEVKIARQHTSASLFNLLYDELHAQSMVTGFGGVATDIEGLAIGDLIEVHGRYVGNPLDDVLALANQFFRYFSPEEIAAMNIPDAPTRGQGSARSGNPAKRAQARPPSPEELAAQELAETRAQERQEQEIGLRMIQEMFVEVQGSTVSDVVVSTSAGLRIVATLAREFLTDQVSALLRASNVTILGKVTALATDSEEINLTRRTVLGAIDGERARELLNAVTGPGGFAWNAEDPIVSGPTAQVMPLAIFV